MKEIVYQVTNPMGVHARPCALLAQCCVNFKSIVTVAANGKVADGRNVLELLALRVKVGDTLTIQVNGEDEDQAWRAVQAVIDKEFNEKKAAKLLRIAFFGAKDYDRIFSAN